MMRSRSLAGACALCLLTLVPTPSGGSKLEERKYRLGYEGALRLWAAGEELSGVEALVECETGALEALGDDSATALRRTELKLIEQLATIDAVTLLPLSGLYEQAYVVYLARSEAALISHAREMVIILAGKLAETNSSARRDLEASRILTSLAGHLHQAKVDSVAAGLYRRALALDPRNRAALIGLSFLHEQYGEYPESLHYLEALVELDPTSGAAQLRLGIHQVRQGREEAGTIYLHEAAREGHPDWIRSVAYQELARILLDRGQQEEARGLLETAVEELPSDPNLLIQLAYLSERNGYYSQDPALLQALGRRGSNLALGSPRYRYSQLPTEALTELRGELERQRAAGLPALKLALESRSGPRVEVSK